MLEEEIQDLPIPLRQATELTEKQVHDLIGETASGDSFVRRRMAEVIWRIYCAKQSETRHDIGMEFGVTTERIRQIEAHALRLIRAPSNREIVKNVVWDDTRFWHVIHYGRLS